MTIEEADEILSKIADLALEIEEDTELQRVDPRYAIVAKCIDTDVDSVSI